MRDLKMSSSVECSEFFQQRQTKNARKSQLAAEIVDALLALDGEAHRTLVLERIGLKRGGPGLRLDSSEGRAVLAAFDAHCLAQAGRQPLFRLRFGPGSHRWGLSADAMSFFTLAGSRATVA
jgi:hypothetical protein